jgi:hypothetical protein
VYLVIRQLLIRLPRLLQSSVAAGFLHHIVTNAECVSQIFQTKLFVWHMCFWTVHCLYLEDGINRFPETSVTNYRSTLSNIPEERRFQKPFVNYHVHNDPQLLSILK